MPFRLAIVETHPIQYKAPWFRRLAEDPDIEIEVMYAMVPDAAQQGAGFGVAFTWDVPLLDGYPWRRLQNVSRKPGVTHFAGCDTPELYREFRHGRWDAVLVNGWVVKSCLQALAGARLAGVPCIVRGEANLLRERPCWKRALHRALLHQYAALLCIGKANREFYLANGVPEGRLFNGPYCVDNERFARAADAARQRREERRTRWSIPPEAFCVLFSGKLIAKKRPLDMLEAVRLAAANGPRNLHALVVGDGALRPACEAFVREHRVPATFAGFVNQSDMPSAYVAADVLMLPSDAGETWGLVVNEAMACGVPAVVSDRVGCHPDLVDPSTGRVYRCGDAAAAARHLAQLASDPQTTAGMGNAARRRVRDFSLEALVQGTRAAVASVVSRGKSRSPKETR